MASLEGYGVVDTGAYQRGSDALNYKFNTDSATNAYGRFLSQQRGSRNLGDLTKNFNRSLPSAYAGFGQRGLSGGGVRSGTMQKSMGNYLGDYAQNYMRSQQDLTQELQGYDLNQANLSSGLQYNLADMETQKQNAIARAAQGLEALRPYFGGT
ncbi:MAG TPA: hypothetical protein VFE69_01490 [Ilumatobacteraceae bacterium]|jgi:hypothetical protein|nr:hypothetical protein [Ilumatobacteraceae bacterium]